MTLPFDEINKYNFPYYIRVFFPRLYNEIYKTFQIRYNHSELLKHNKRLDSNKKVIYQDYSLLMKVISSQKYVKELYSRYNKIYIYTEFKYDGTQNWNEKKLFEWMLDHRHLEDFWVESHTFKQI